ncbi:MAG: 30S ribosomal protein S16 [candidate division KSB1 bacterium]|nr:30S ribosomal protein S16 [candidate division KSB1 bacterium]
MAVKLRLRRMGKKKQPFYRIVAIDSRTSRNGKYIDKVGHYNPLVNPAEIVIDEQKAFYWLNHGAIPSETVKSLFSQKGLLLKWDMMRKGFEPTRIEEEMKKWEVLQLERQRRREAEALKAKAEAEAPPQQSEPAPEAIEEKAETQSDSAGSN